MTAMAKRADMKPGIEFPSAAFIRPGDSLILGFSRYLGPDECDRVSKLIADKLPGINITVIDQLDHMVAYRPEAETA